MERLTIINEFLDEINFEVPSDMEGAYDILDIAKYSDEEEKINILLEIAERLTQYENTGLTPEQILKLQETAKHSQSEVTHLLSQIENLCDQLSRATRNIHVKTGFDL